VHNTVPACREMLYLDLALEGVVRSAAERGAGKAAGASAAPLVGPLLQNLALSIGDNEEVGGCSLSKLALQTDSLGVRSGALN
jgi:alpha-glucan, water dikinase